MSNKIIVAAALGFLLTPIAANAVIVTGTFSGTFFSGTDGTTGVVGSSVFGLTPGTDLTNDTLSGTFTYNTSLLTPDGSLAETYDSTSLGAITATVTILGVTHTFVDQLGGVNSTVYLDPASSEIQVMNAQSQAGTTEGFSVEADDAGGPAQFVTSGDPTQQNFTADTTDAFFNSLGVFTIQDTNAFAVGDFTLTALSVSTSSASVPEPASLALLTVGLGGIGLIRRRRAVALKA